MKQHKDEKDQVRLKGVPKFKMPTAQIEWEYGMGLVKKVKGEIIKESSVVERQWQTDKQVTRPWRVGLAHC